MLIPKMVFIVPYRNREYLKKHFSIYMKYILEDYNKDDYEIYFSHQQDNKPFTRGGAKNIGFLAIKEKYPNNYKDITFVFNDIDTLPYEKNIINYITTDGIIKHFYGFTFTLGGIFSIIGSDFEKCNGFPNLYGWGLEDNAMNDRVLSNNMKIDRSTFFSIGSANIINFLGSPIKLVDNKDPSKYIKKQFNDNLNTIKNLKYNIENNIENVNDNKSNEFIINITNFETLLDPLSGQYYKKDVSVNTNLEVNYLEKIQTRKKWSLNRFMIKK